MAKDNNSVKEFKPYIPADKVLPELTATSIVIGLILAVVFGAANAYLGLKVGMTISASIPAAVISMGIIRGILKRESILENNIVQTIGSAGESLAAGAIFTLPALYIWSKEWDIGAPSLLTITVISLFGGILGTLFMIPLRKALIVNEHNVLPYPEGTACAEVLLAGEEGGEKAKTTFIAVGIGALYKFIADGLKLFPSEIETTIKGYKGAAIGADILPALLGVGFIIGAKISAYMLAGAVIGWFALIPLITHLGSLGEIVMYPSKVPIGELDHWGIWDNYIRYVGAGAVAFGGIFSLLKSLPLIWRTFRDSIRSYSGGIDKNNDIRTDRDMSVKIIIIAILAVILAIGIFPFVPVGITGALIIAVFGFFFATVSSRIVGLVGSSSNPVSGMTIATLIIAAIIFKAAGIDGQAGSIATLSVGAVICIISAIAGDTSQDLKTGFLVGATPQKQQYGEILGVIVAALAIGGVLTLLDHAWGFGSSELPAPQATLMRLVIEGVMGGNLPWVFVFVGVGIGIAVELLGLPVLPIAIGLYLPIHLSAPIMVGGMIRGMLDRRLSRAGNEDVKIKKRIESGILYSSGLIAGEGLIGILLAVFAVLNLDVDAGINLGQLGGLIFFALLVLTLIRHSVMKKVGDRV